MSDTEENDTKNTDWFTEVADATEAAIEELLQQESMKKAPVSHAALSVVEEKSLIPANFKSVKLTKYHNWFNSANCPKEGVVIIPFKRDYKTDRNYVVFYYRLHSEYDILRVPHVYVYNDPNDGLSVVGKFHPRKNTPNLNLHVFPFMRSPDAENKITCDTSRVHLQVISQAVKEFWYVDKMISKEDLIEDLMQFTKYEDSDNFPASSFALGGTIFYGTTGVWEKK